MKSRRGSPAFLLILLLFTILCTLLMALRPNRDAPEVKITVVHEMVALMDGFGVPRGTTEGLLQRIPWNGVGLLGAVLVAFTLLQPRRSASEQHRRQGS